MTDRKWHSGPPPHVWWWNASPFNCNDVWRWWNGSRWSGPVTADATPSEVARAVKVESRFGVDDIYWSDYYPENASVPRVNPEERTA